MNPEQWARVKEVFHAALEHAAEHRGSFVAGLCDTDVIVRSEISSGPKRRSSACSRASASFAGFTCGAA